MLNIIKRSGKISKIQNIHYFDNTLNYNIYINENIKQRE